MSPFRESVSKISTQNSIAFLFKQFFLFKINVKRKTEAKNCRKNNQQSVVSIHGPLGYGPSTLPLRHSATHDFYTSKTKVIRRKYFPTSSVQTLSSSLGGGSGSIPHPTKAKSLQNKAFLGVLLKTIQISDFGFFTLWSTNFSNKAGASRIKYEIFGHQMAAPIQGGQVQELKWLSPSSFSIFSSFQQLTILFIILPNTGF